MIVWTSDDLAEAVRALLRIESEVMTLIVTLASDDDDGLALTQVRVSTGLGRWHVSAYGMGLGRDFGAAGPIEDEAALYAAIARLGEHTGRPGRLRAVT